MSDDDLAAPFDDEATEDTRYPAPIVDAGDKKSLSKRQRNIDYHRRQAAEFWKGVFASPVGRREMWAILQSMHTFEQRFQCGPNGFPNPDATWYALGEQNSGRRLYDSWLLLARDGVLLMQDELDPRFAGAAIPPDDGGE
jgi:hypothetical protein